MHAKCDATHDLGNINLSDFWCLSHTALLKRLLDAAKLSKHHLKTIGHVGHAANSRRSPIDSCLGQCRGVRLNVDRRVLNTRLPIIVLVLGVQTEGLFVQTDGFGIVTHVVIRFAQHRPVTNRIQESHVAELDRSRFGSAKIALRIAIIGQVETIKAQVIVLIGQRLCLSLAGSRSENEKRRSEAPQDKGSGERFGGAFSKQESGGGRQKRIRIEPKLG